MDKLSESNYADLLERASELLCDGYEAEQIIEDFCSEYPDVDPSSIADLVSDAEVEANSEE